MRFASDSTNPPDGRDPYQRGVLANYRRKTYCHNVGSFLIPEFTVPVDPLEAWYVKVNGYAVGRLIPSIADTPPPSRDLPDGISLIGPAPSYDQGVFPAMPLDQALISIDKAPGGKTRYIMVISPGHNQPGWGYARGGTIHDLLAYKGYWVVM